MSQIFQLPKTVPFSSARVVSGAKITFYLTGTTTLTDTYTTDALSVAHTNPVVADTNGVFPVIFLDPAIRYKATLTTSADVLIYTQDPVNDSLPTQAQIGAILYPRTDAEISAGLTPVDKTVPSLEACGLSLPERFANNTTPGTTDMTAALQAAHDVLPSTGGMIYCGLSQYYLLAIDGTYVSISKPNVTVSGENSAWIISPNSSDAEVTTGSRYLNGFNVTGNDCVISVNMRGPLVLWNASSANTDRLSLKDMIFRNLYNSGVAITGANGFDTLDVDGVLFDTSRALASDLGNYEAISRSSNSTAPAGNLVRVNRSTFRGVAGGVDVHNLRNLVIGGGTRFEGCDQTCIKTATLDGLVTEMNVAVDESVTFDGAAINAASANRHLNCTGDSRSVANYSRYLGFFQMIYNNQFHGKAKNFKNIGIDYLDGSFTNAVTNLDYAKFDTCPAAVQDAQGSVSMRGMELISSTVLWTSIGTLRSLEFTRNRMRDSVLNVTKKAVSANDVLRVEYNEIDYSVDNNGAIRFTNFTTDSAPFLLVNNNKIAITGGGNTVVADLSSSGTRGFWGPNNQISAAAGTATVTGGYFPHGYEQQTVAGSPSLNLFKRYDNEVTVVNPNAAGTIGYQIADASMVAPIGARFSAVRTSAQLLRFTCSGGTVDGTNQTASADAQNASAIFTKVAANQWRVQYSGTWTFF